MIEQFTTIEDFPNYEVSNTGLVRNKTTGRILHGCPNKIGYVVVHLHQDKKGKSFNLHSLVGKYWVPGWFPGAELNHIDECKTHNFADNLEWVSHTKNMNHGTVKQRIMDSNHQNKNWKAVRCIETGEVFNSIREAQIAAGVTWDTFMKYFKGRTKAIKGLHYEKITGNSCNS